MEWYSTEFSFFEDKLGEKLLMQDSAKELNSLIQRQPCSQMSITPSDIAETSRHGYKRTSNMAYRSERANRPKSARKQETEAKITVKATDVTLSNIAAKRISCSSHSVETNRMLPRSVSGRWMVGHNGSHLYWLLIGFWVENDVPNTCTTTTWTAPLELTFGSKRQKSPSSTVSHWSYDDKIIASLTTKTVSSSAPFSNFHSVIIKTTLRLTLAPLAVSAEETRAPPLGRANELAAACWPRRDEEQRRPRPPHKEKKEKKTSSWPAAVSAATGTMDDRSQSSGRAGDRTVAVYHRGCMKWWPSSRQIWGRVAIATLWFPQF
ncbi:hypothetical protein L484_005053 [Morus notabilis]|uniref:Uncharacterized protein n=1 Tax=Morus notabilis TaxID=981085 RepID=W9QUS7_9ROSA|nr:hypothetical protein L484_005053 [Morus notabilis]